MRTMDNSLSKATDIVVESFADTPSPRLRETLVSLTRHLHGWVRDVDPTMHEWNVAIDFLTRVGHMCDDTRQEFMLLSDVLGVTNLVDQLESRHGTGRATETTALGPFHMVQSPRRDLGDQIMSPHHGDPCWVSGRVLDVDEAPVPGAAVDVWQADDDGFYDVQIPDQVDVGVGRAMFTADEHGEFFFRTVVPAPYPIPTDGPVGELLAVTNRHPNRPAHIHFIVEAPGYQSLTTHLFVEGSDWLDADAVFATKDSLVAPFIWVDDQDVAAARELPSPHREARFDIRLARQS